MYLVNLETEKETSESLPHLISVILKIAINKSLVDLGFEHTNFIFAEIINILYEGSFDFLTWAGRISWY